MSDEKHVCEECGFEAKSASGLAAHSRKHQNDEPAEGDPVADDCPGEGWHRTAGGNWAKDH